MDNERVKRRALLALELLAKEQGIKLKPGEIPQVEIKDGKDPRETSSYDFEKNVIYIAQKHEDSPIAYFEESSHALRELMLRRKILYRLFPKLKDKATDHQVDEFYGRIGETIGREVAGGTEFEELFRNTPPRDMKDPETRKRWAERLRMHRKSIRGYRDLQRQVDGTRTNIRSALEDNYRRYKIDSEAYRNREIDEAELKKRVTLYGQRVVSSIPQTGKVSKQDPQDIERYLFHIDSLIKTLTIGERNKGDEKIRQLIETALKDDLPKYLDPQNYLDDAAIEFAATKHEVGIYTHMTHKAPYEIAQQYTAGELEQIPNLYSLSNSKARDRLFKRREEPRSKLEKSLNILIIIATGLLAFMFMPKSFTGFSVLDNNGLNSQIEFVLTIILSLSLVVFLYLKYKSRNSLIKNISERY